jgi:hypothetical protein
MSSMGGRRPTNRNASSDHFYTDAFKPDHCKPPRKCSWIDQDHRVSDMKKPEQKTIQAVGAWVGATMIAAAFGCVLSWVPTSFALTAAAAVTLGDVTLSFPAIARITLETGALVGLVWAVAQYAVLRLHAHHAGSWILSNALAWTASFTSLYLAAFLPDRTTSPAFHIILTAIAGVVLGSFLGLLNGYVLVRLRSRLLNPHSAR